MNPFDRCCEIVETHFPEHREAMREARLFVMQKSDASQPGFRLEAWEPDEKVVQNFRPPFPVVAIQCDDYAAVVETIDADRRSYRTFGMLGKSDWFCGEVQAFPDNQDFCDVSQIGRVVDVRDLRAWFLGKREIDEALFSRSELSIRSGYSEVIAALLGPKMESTAKDLMHVGKLQAMPRSMVAMRKQRLHREMGESRADYEVVIGNAALLSVNVMILRLLAICEPSKFILEERLAVPKERKLQPGEIPRARDRSRFIVLSPGEIKKRYLYDDHDPTGIQRIPHERRGHFRRLQSERYTTRRGEVIWIKPCWVGKTEAVRGRNRYIVRLDL